MKPEVIDAAVLAELSTALDQLIARHTGFDLARDLSRADISRAEIAQLLCRADAARDAGDDGDAPPAAGRLQ